MNINLARKWRSKTFDQMVGQELAVKMLKNSLYLDHYFPVYLFSGQRGCGKTSAARIFAGAVNCTQLLAFQKNPKNCNIPCLNCPSCFAMLAGNHPDFIEIDAASHTGVDNVRNIIDAATLMPVLGSKRIYLIDEAHMLSKAAFNAFLKILEEPPHSVLFILATTDPHKIIDTVRSRSFQLLFKPVESTILADHLAQICNAEGISYQHEALLLLAREAEGSVRDALNLLEQVRFSHNIVSKEAVFETMGYLDEERLINLFATVMSADPSLLFETMQTLPIKHYDTHTIWDDLIALFRFAIRLKYNVSSEQSLQHQKKRIEQVIDTISVATLISCLQCFYAYEPMLLKARDRYSILEMVLLTICRLISEERPVTQQKKTDIVQESPISSPLNKSEVNKSEEWQKVLEHIAKLDDPLLESIFKQPNAVDIDYQKNSITLQYPENLSFFADMLESMRKEWQNILNVVFKHPMQLNYTFSGHAKQIDQEKKTAPKLQNYVQKEYKKPYVYKQSNQKNQIHKEQVVDVSDANHWQKAHMLMREFPGIVVQAAQEDDHDTVA